MGKRTMCILFAALLVGALVLPAAAAENTGEIRIEIGGSGGEVTLYKVGEFITGGFRLYESYGGGTVTDLDALSPELAAWLAQKTEGGTAMQAENGVCRFGKLSEGLYLAVQTEAGTGYRAFQPFLISVPWDGNMWEIDAKPKIQAIPTVTPQTGESSRLILAVIGMAASFTGIVACLTRKEGYFKKRY